MRHMSALPTDHLTQLLNIRVTHGKPLQQRPGIADWSQGITQFMREHREEFVLAASGVRKLQSDAHLFIQMSAHLVLTTSSAQYHAHRADKRGPAKWPLQKQRKSIHPQVRGQHRVSAARTALRKQHNERYIGP